MEKSLRVVLIDQGEITVTNFSRTNEEPVAEIETLKTSQAWMDWHGNSAAPTLIITKSKITVELQNIGGGHTDWSRLSGPSGTYFFQTSGTADVVPGTYSHSVSGYIGGNNQSSKIASVITYE